MHINDWINRLHLEPHPEGGYFKQTYKSLETTQLSDGRLRFLSSSILFLLTSSNPSHFHRLKSDEIWYYHHGHPLTIHLLHPNGTYQQVILGLDHHLQYKVPKGTIFGSTVNSTNPDDFAIVSCSVTPAFEYADFELFTKEQLYALYPNHAEIINTLTYD
ncbi:MULTISPECIES: cupin domain-containing protein [unclassified Granulicatella]|uniref:cupin domain-containing protein n=1 Tax=unclassified Granulicatella TaxID=2630493 RepID=UPI001073DD7C|nr:MULTISPECIES: cupin domain-containing protein [unclassified Granulicatella]MBF0779859.1 cupin domain-containing protein [Granulicatella sp. 19428wC4_WM01]TFU96063.1 cupin domain-containing protein [Granulicatella sp. WM01]